ncbi:hypothetical protein GLUCOINTEAF2_0204241 [Komagataeibacter intermedius AF2]|uniref:Uncharacterized protein n=1 Tax=Komagataeibacter intermedius AF2 TaxID=1458464 RepID=A0A0N1FBH5_9PROT|nr:hypothetical protein GLUCOINTEAF2_0204241 [Komagataeibacter intermedius AF2]
MSGAGSARERRARAGAVLHARDDRGRAASGRGIARDGAVPGSCGAAGSASGGDGAGRAWGGAGAGGGRGHEVPRPVCGGRLCRDGEEYHAGCRPRGMGRGRVSGARGSAVGDCSGRAGSGVRDRKPDAGLPGAGVGAWVRPAGARGRAGGGRGRHGGVTADGAGAVGRARCWGQGGAGR